MNVSTISAKLKQQVIAAIFISAYLFTLIPTCLGAITRVVVAKDGSPQYLVRAAVDALGGMSRYVKPGQAVAIKVDASMPKVPELGKTTNPDLVSEIIEMLREAGAGQILIIDNPVHDPRVCFSVSGIQTATELSGGTISTPREHQFFWPQVIFEGKYLRKAEISSDLLASDVVINVPVMKSSYSTGVALGMKNMLSMIWKYQDLAKGNLDQSIADISTVMKPKLIILDGTHLSRSLPGKRSLVVAGTDPVAVDGTGARIIGVDPTKVGHIVKAYESGIGQLSTGANQNTISVRRWGVPERKVGIILMIYPVAKEIAKILFSAVTIILFLLYFLIRSRLRNREERLFHVG